MRQQCSACTLLVFLNKVKLFLKQLQLPWAISNHIIIRV